MKLDLEPYKVETLKQMALIEKEYMSAATYGKLNEDEQKTLIARFLRENMVEPFQYLWSINKHIVNHPEGKRLIYALNLELIPVITFRKPLINQPLRFNFKIWFPKNGHVFQKKQFNNHFNMFNLPLNSMFNNRVNMFANASKQF